MTWYNCKPQHITKETLNLPHLGVPNFRCAHALLFYPLNGCIFGHGIQVILYGFSMHYHMLHMGMKLWYLGMLIWQHPTLTFFIVCFSKLLMLIANAIAKVEIPHL
jgi:hypothetical protein